MFRRTLIPVGLAVASAVLLAGPAGSAHATPAFLAKKTYFTFSFWMPRPKQECITRTILLREGYYTHGAYMVAMWRRDRRDMATNVDVPLNGGTYRWQVCRWFAAGKYQVSSRIGNRERRNSLDAPYRFGSGVYEWGGRLEWTGPFGLTHPS